MQALVLRRKFSKFLFAILSSIVTTASFSTENEALLVISKHRFEPAELKIPANQRVRLTIHNTDSTAEEFESHALNREKLIPAGKKVVIFIGPLKAGTYAFVGEYNEASAKGVVIAE